MLQQVSTVYISVNSMLSPIFLEVRSSILYTLFQNKLAYIHRKLEFEWWSFKKGKCIVFTRSNKSEGSCRLKVTRVQGFCLTLNLTNWCTGFCIKNMTKSKTRNFLHCYVSLVWDNCLLFNSICHLNFLYEDNCCSNARTLISLSSLTTTSNKETFAKDGKFTR